jgi:hypothetical protein
MRPKMRDRMPPTIGTPTNRKISSVPKATGCRARGVAAFAGSGAPLPTTAMIRSTPALIPSANLFWRKSGATV